MNFKILISTLVLFFALTVKGNVKSTGFDKSAFYAAIASNDIEVINTQLEIVKAASISEKTAYEGFLLMKKAGIVKSAKEKLSLFKAGRTKLEASIKKENKNSEFNFLRLIIQEHAPKIVKYDDNIQGDVIIVRSNYKSLPQIIQQAIIDYSKNSKALKLL